jgi:hypothetical protein
MTTLNALGFFLLGIVMIFLPVLAPGYFIANATDGSNTSALWLGIMGIFQGFMGTFFIFRNEAMPLAVRLMTLRLPAFKPAERRVASGFILRPLQNGYMAGQSSNEQRLAA